jgi:hypothetical protein
MQDLTLVGLTEDKSKLVLVSDSGDEYTLAADAKLRAALRGDHARLGQLEIKMDSALRPRDIQARIRAGESPEAVAQAAQTSVDRIMGYATPVLAERAHIADRAQRASVRRKAGEGPARLLGDAVAERLRAKNVDPESVEWDAWRREDGRWTLVADYPSGERTRRAEFVFDAPGRYVVAEDDEARWLVGEQSARKTGQPRSGTGSSRRLSSVSAEDELPLGDDAIEMVTGSGDLGPEQLSLEGTDDVSPHERTIDLSQTARQLREQPDVDVETGDADWIATQASERPAAPAGAGSAEQPVTAAEATTPDTAADTHGATDAGTEQAASDEEKPKEPAAKKSSRKGRRASVPSWDEIMFGGGRSE